MEMIKGHPLHGSSGGDTEATTAVTNPMGNDVEQGGKSKAERKPKLMANE